MEKQFETRQIPPMYARAKVGSIDTENMTFDVVFATDGEVDMWDWERGNYVEILDMGPNSVRLDRLNSGAPLLDNHRSNDGVCGVLGAVVRGSAKVDGNMGMAKIMMSDRPELMGVWSDIKRGILSTVSVGYAVYKAVLEDTQRNLYRAMDWEPFEISIAPIPADINAQIREHKQSFKAEIEIPAKENDYQADLDMLDLTLQRNKYNY